MRTVAVAIVLAVGLGVSACTASSAPIPSSGVTATSASPESRNPATTAPAVADSRIVIGVQDMAVIRDGAMTLVDYRDAASVLDLLTEVTGEDPPAVPVPLYNGMDLGLDTYSFTGVRVTVPRDSSGTASVAVGAPTINGIPVATSEGIAVGSGRAVAVAAGAGDGWDEDQDGIADYLHLGRVEVPGVESLATPGTTGSLFVLLSVPGDVVTELQAPSNDFSDI